MGNKQKFFSQLQNLYVGAKLDGKGGMANLLQFKCQYFERIKPLIEAEIKKNFPDSSDNNLPELYEKLYTFFSSYLTDGGSIYFSDTPAYKNVYAKVYFDKEDTALFYKTKDLYYVKSQIMYQSLENLTFNHENKAIGIYFDFNATDYTPTNNNTKEKVLILFTGVKNQKLQFKVIEQSQIINQTSNIDDEQLKDIDEANLYSIKKSNTQLLEESSSYYAINFSQNDKNRKSVLKFLADNGIETTEEIINKAINIYKKQNEVDFFIHKNAKGFLTEQFNIFIYNYLSNDMDSLLEQKRLDNIRKIKTIAFSIIDYIAKFEDELKAIWNKPKFVRNSNYVVTLDKLIAKGLDISLLTNHAGVKAQIKEWQDLGIVDEKFNIGEITQTQDMFADSKYKYLPFDTKHFDNDIKYAILSLFDNLDEECDGVLIKSDNYQALNTIMPKYKEQVDLIYIDPPFNTGSDFTYLDNYQDSTWCSIMMDRLNLSKSIMSDKGSIYVHLDYRANHYNRMLMDNIFGQNNLVNEVIWLFNTGGIPDNLGFQKKHHNILFYKKSESPIWNKVLAKSYIRGDFFNPEQERAKELGIKKDEYGLYRMNLAKSVWEMGALFRNSKELISYDGEKLTQKPEAVLARIITSSTNEKSFVSDFFAGSGTTIASAHKLNRKWLGIEMGAHFYLVIIPRMKKVLFGAKVGISETQEVKIGGLFKYYELEQYEDVLDKAVYNYTDNNIANLAYDFSNNEKLAHDGLVIDYADERNPIHYSFETLYPDVDIWETISNFYGYKIKQYHSSNQVTYITRDGREITLSKDKITFDNMPELKALIWW